jgi:predicted PurR-regulated permease PerM
MGVALIAGSVVHVGTLQNGFTRYVLLGFLGLFFMILGNILEAKNLGHKIDVRYLLIITALSFSTGFMSGGIQYYLDNPVYAGYLLSFGLFISYVTFFWKEKTSLNYKNTIMVLFVSILIFAFSHYIIAPKILQSTETTITPEHGH